MCLVHAREGARVRLWHSLKAGFRWKMKAALCLLSGAWCVTKNIRVNLSAWQLHCGARKKSVKQSCRGWFLFFSWWESWARIRRGRGSEGVRRERTRSPDYCSCTDGAADETAGMEGWGVRARQEHREMARDHVFVRVHKEHGAGQLPRKTL